jgi:hypothetical protein
VVFFKVLWVPERDVGMAPLRIRRPAPDARAPSWPDADRTNRLLTALSEFQVR